MKDESAGVNAPDLPTADRRRTRWDGHREQRRQELIQAAIAAFLEHGPDVDMAQVAAAARVSKPILYRYFADKAQLWHAAGEYVAQLVVAAVEPAISQVREDRGLIAATVDAYLAAIESHSELYRFIVHQTQLSGGPGVVTRASEVVAIQLARVIGDRLRAMGLDAGPAVPWAYGVVGLVLSVGDWWMQRGRPMTRPALTEYTTTLIWQGIDGIRSAADLPIPQHMS
jgi:AcrR family transcriptional regulator